MFGAKSRTRVRAAAERCGAFRAGTGGGPGPRPMCGRCRRAVQTGQAATHISARAAVRAAGVRSLPHRPGGLRATPIGGRRPAPRDVCDYRITFGRTP